MDLMEEFNKFIITLIKEKKISYNYDSKEFIDTFGMVDFWSVFLIICNNVIVKFSRDSNQVIKYLKSNDANTCKVVMVDSNIDIIVDEVDEMLSIIKEENSYYFEEIFGIMANFFVEDFALTNEYEDIIEEIENSDVADLFLIPQYKKEIIFNYVMDIFEDYAISLEGEKLIKNANEYYTYLINELFELGSPQIRPYEEFAEFLKSYLFFNVSLEDNYAYIFDKLFYTKTQEKHRKKEIVQILFYNFYKKLSYKDMKYDYYYLLKNSSLEDLSYMFVNNKDFRVECVESFFETYYNSDLDNYIPEDNEVFTPQLIIDKMFKK